MTEEKSVSSVSCFDRARLKKIVVIKSNKGNYCVRVKTLDRDSLIVTTGKMVFSSETLEIVAGLVLQSMGVSGIHFKEKH